MNSTDALSSGAQLLELVAAGPAGRQQLVASGVQPVILQVRVCAVWISLTR